MKWRRYSHRRTVCKGQVLIRCIERKICVRSCLQKGCRSYVPSRFSFEKNEKDASKPLDPFFFHNMTICSLFLHQVNAEAVGTSNTNLNSAPSMNTSRSTDLFIILCSYHHFSTNGMVLPPFIQTYHPQPLYSLRRRANARNTSLFISSRRKFHLYQLINLFDSTSVPLETNLSCND